MSYYKRTWNGSPIVALLVWIGLVRVTDKGIRWPIHVSPWWIWKSVIKAGPFNDFHPWFGFFRNLPQVIKWEPGRLLPRRWGVYFIGLEIGDRG